MRLPIPAAAGLACIVAACGGGSGDSGATPTTFDRVSIIASAPANVPSGSAMQLDVFVTNSAADAATNVAATIALGAGLTQTSVTCSASAGASCPVSGTSLTVASLPGHGSLHFQIGADVTVGARGALVSTATVSADNEAASGNNSAQITVNAFSADLAVSGTGPNTLLASGGTANYTMTVSNAGPDTASDVVVENVVDSQQTLAAIVCTAAGGAVCPLSNGATMSIPSLPPRGSVTFSVSATISAQALGAVSNTLYVSQAGDPVSSNNVATVTAETVIPTTPTASFVRLQSAPGDYIGAGHDYAYSQANAVFMVTVSAGHLSFNVTGDEGWNADFLEPSSLSRLQPGTYLNLQRYPFDDAAVGGLSWSGEGRGCNTLTGFFIIDAATYSAGTLTSIDLRFEQHCEGAGPALAGQIHWVAGDPTRPPGPATPPTTLWRPAAGTTPSTGNYVYLQSDAGDFVGAGMTATYTQANAVLALSVNGARLDVGVTGNDDWTGNFLAMNTLTQLQPGYYAGLRRYPFNNPTTGGIDWSGNGRGCNTEMGWFVVDSVSYSGGALASIDLRFEQHCEGGAAALHGQIHWIAGDPTQPPGPQNPPPAGLWLPPAGAVPTSGNYIYLQSDAGDYVGAGASYLYTPATDAVTVSGSAGHATIGVDGQGGWAGSFVAMNSISQLAPGYYGNVQRWPFNNPATGGLDWSGFGRGCNMLTGWFVIDSISFSNGNVASLDLRFEQHCEGGTPALHGKMHWIN